MKATSIESLKRWFDNLRFAIACVVDCEPTFMDDLLKRGRDAPPLKYTLLKKSYKSNESMRRLSELCFDNGYIVHLGDNGTLEYIPKDGQFSMFDSDKTSYFDGLMEASYV